MKKKKTSPTLIVLLILIPALILSVFISQQQTQYKQQAATQFQFTHDFGAFSVGSATAVAQSLGINATLEYGYNPGASGTKGGMKLIDDMPDEYIRQFAKDNSLTNLTNSMTAHLKEVQNNTKIVAYWVLDDTNKNGTAKQALVQVTTLIHQYTPGKPSICGFTGNSRPWPVTKADNFSPQGCDMIAPYIYPQGSEKWDLSDIWPTMEAAFKARGWDINTTPLVGVPLSYGGANGYTVPTAQQAETEAKAFCQAGATSLIWYDFGTGTNASTDTGVQQGIKAGIADCKAIWGTASNPSSSGSSSSSQPVPSTIVPSFVCAGGINCVGTPVPSSGAGAPIPSAAVSSGPITVPSTSVSVIPSNSNQLPSISIPPTTGESDQDLINQLKALIKKLEDILKQLGGNSGHRRHHHHHYH